MTWHAASSWPQDSLLLILILCSYNPIHYDSAYGLHWSSVARPTSMQDITTIDMAIHGIRCDQASVEWIIFVTLIIVLFTCHVRVC